MTSSDEDALALLARAGLPDALLVLARRYPRVDWPNHPNLGPLAQFWLGRHLMFRQLSHALTETADAARSRPTEARPVLRQLGRPLQLLLGELEGHHRIEDFHYFPVLTKLEPRLQAGFDLLEQDHEALHRMLHGMAEAWQSLERSAGAETLDEAALERMARSLGDFLQPLERHLEDEEDLVIPVILDRGEFALG